MPITIMVGACPLKKMQAIWSGAAMTGLTVLGCFEWKENRIKILVNKRETLAQVRCVQDPRRLPLAYQTIRFISGLDIILREIVVGANGARRVIDDAIIRPRIDLKVTFREFLSEFFFPEEEYDVVEAQSCHVVCLQQLSQRIPIHL
jgi:hypothetical protein